MTATVKRRRVVAPVMSSDLSLESPQPLSYA